MIRSKCRQNKSQPNNISVLLANNVVDRNIINVVIHVILNIKLLSIVRVDCSSNIHQ